MELNWLSLSILWFFEPDAFRFRFAFIRVNPWPNFKLSHYRNITKFARLINACYNFALRPNRFDWYDNDWKRD